MEDSKRIIEINGIKMEVDLRHAKVIDTFKVGDTVKVLIKGYLDYKSHVGMIVGFDEFKNLPTIVVAYLNIDYASTAINFVYINSESKDVEICKINDWDIPYSKTQILDRMQVEIDKKAQEVKDLETKKEVFLTMFGKYFDGRISNNDSDSAF